MPKTGCCSVIAKPVINNAQLIMLLAEDLKQREPCLKYFSFWKQRELLPFCLVLRFSNTLTRKAVFVMQTADSKSDVLMVAEADGWTVSGAWPQEEEVSFGLSQAQIPPLLAMSAFPISSESKPRIAPIGQRAMEREKNWKSERTRERRVKKHFIRWIPPHSVNILQIYIRHYLHFVRYNYKQVEATMIWKKNKMKKVITVFNTGNEWFYK